MATITDERLAELIKDYAVTGDWTGAYMNSHQELVSILTELQSLRSQAEVSESVAFVSPEQFEDHGDPSPDEEPFGGLYLPVRLTRAGNFTMPLYARPAPIEITEEMSPFTKAEMDVVLREAFPNVRDEDMGDHVTLILCQKGPQDA